MNDLSETNVSHNMSIDDGNLLERVSKANRTVVPINAEVFEKEDDPIMRDFY